MRDLPPDINMMNTIKLQNYLAAGITKLFSIIVIIVAYYFNSSWFGWLIGIYIVKYIILLADIIDNIL